MGAYQVELNDVHHGPPPSRKRLLAPLRYLSIKHPEKTWYDFVVPVMWAAAMFGCYWIVHPKPALFGEVGLIKLVRDLLIMAVPFMIGALAAVAMGSPGPHLDRRLVGAPLYLDGQSLTLRQFVCYLLGYLSFVGLVLLVLCVAAAIGKDTVQAWTSSNVQIADWMIASELLALTARALGSAILFGGLAVLTVTVLWGLYFLTVIVNRND